MDPLTWTVNVAAVLTGACLIAMQFRRTERWATMLLILSVAVGGIAALIHIGREVL